MEKYGCGTFPCVDKMRFVFMKIAFNNGFIDFPTFLTIAANVLTVVLISPPPPPPPTIFFFLNEAK